MTSSDISGAFILLIDDEPGILTSSRMVLLSEGFRDVLTVQDSRQVLPLLSERGDDIALIVLDLYMPHIPGKELLTAIAMNYPHIPVVVMTGLNDIETAVQCVKAGAADYLVKPVENSHFISVIKKNLEIRTLLDEVSSLKQYLLTDALRCEDAFAHIITRSKKMRAIFQYIEAIAPSPRPAMICGETGVGKELIARAIHALSRRSGSFIPVNAAGLDDTIFSDTLFGHRKGAFTGADDTREGLIAKASGGTLFLDEIGDLSGASQVKLLRLLQERMYYPLGSDIPQKSNARIIVATNKDIQHSIAAGVFRKDLYYRLCAHRIHVPPLRERAEDIPLLVAHFMEETAKSLKRECPSFEPGLITYLSQYDFPGNIRELQEAVYDAVIRNRSGMLTIGDFREVMGSLPSSAPGRLPLDERGAEVLHTLFGHFPTLDEMEEYLVNKALSLSKDNQSRAASLLGLTRQALHKRLKKKKQ
ncbi:MAG: sigma-54 dependent transcriptional regulator [Alphaproteobacteria bacterium]|uniref:Sigma-54 dependent transcriptional regulator n=1 Tax=Candidatus Nitrobium versatile TaxID=2884831 RepID=A0A953JCT6_9BACT|nr:sigma-54 dependent transcriptional regulator [Candidatus Nitrobium versatile]